MNPTEPENTELDFYRYWSGDEMAKELVRLNKLLKQTQAEIKDIQESLEEV